MNRPTEQLIRDYLNRLSLAARTRLEPGDRQALLDHTRARIDVGCGGAAHPTADQVRRTLAGLGDPIALVENERSRIEARKAWDEAAASCSQPREASRPPADVGSPALKDPAAQSKASGSQRQVWPPPSTPVIARRPFMPPVILPPATANAQVSSVGPVAAAAQPLPSIPALSPGSQIPVAAATGGSQQPVSAVNGSGPASVPPLANVPAAGTPPAAAGRPAPYGPGDAPARTQAAASGDPSERPGPARPTSPIAPRGLPPVRGVPAPRGLPPANDSQASGNEPAPPGGAGRGEGGSAGSNGMPPRPPAPRPAPAGDETATSPGPAVRASGQGGRDHQPGPGGKPADEDVPGVEYGADRIEIEVEENRLADFVDAAVRQLKRLGSALLTIALRDRLETISLLLLGIGGAIYPPIWLVGAIIAISSKKWDLRDKWIGLTLPVLVVVIGTALEVTFGAHFDAYWSYVVEAWVAAGRLSRVGAVLGALYLLWRSHRHGGARTERLPPWSPQHKPGR